MRKSKIEIFDSVQRRKNGPRQYGYRVRLAAANGEILQTSEHFTSYQAVRKHIVALGKVFAITAAWELWSVTKIVDKTEARIWKNPFETNG